MPYSANDDEDSVVDLDSHRRGFPTCHSWLASTAGPSWIDSSGTPGRPGQDCDWQAMSPDGAVGPLPGRGPTERQDRLPGSFVMTATEHGFGRIVRSHGAEVDVQFLLCLNPERRAVTTVAASEVSPMRIPVDTPVFIRHLDRVIPGRVAAVSDDTREPRYEVDLPANSRRSFGEAELEVRCFDVLKSLPAMVSALVADTQDSFDRRLETINALVSMRGLTYGLGGLLSSSVDLLPHQVEVVARVGSDPIIRYLLSDEVGLGKTIEAAAIVKDYLQRSPQSNAVVAVPQHLLDQWRQEVQGRFSGDDLYGRLSIEPHQWLTFDRPAPTMLVVDEVHTIVSKRGMEATFSGLCRLSRKAHALLLLTATPVMSSDRATIRLLHLLDPANHRLGDVDRYKSLMDRRTAVRDALLMLSGGDSKFEAEQAAAAVEQAVPGDAGGLELVAALRAAASENHSAAIREARLGLRQYLSDGYRLHHRMLRTRRRDLREAGYFYRSGRVDVEWDLTTRARAAASALKDWRYQSLLWLDNQTLGPDRDRNEHLMVGRYCRLAEVLGNGASEIRKAVERQRLSVSEGKLPTFVEDDALLSRLIREAPSHGQAVASMVGSIRQALAVQVAKGQKSPKFVAFTSSAEIARSIDTELRQPGASISAFAVTAQTSVGDVRRIMREFREVTHPAVLVCDRAGEAGLNLQFATLIFHLDLPFSVMRMEQRIGRLDRIGRTLRTFDHRVCLPANRKDGPWLDWLTILRDGFRVFDESVADLQLIAVGVQNERQRELFLRGHVGGDEVEVVRDRVIQERENLDAQYMLDRLEVSDSHATRRLQEVIAADSRIGEIAPLFSKWWSTEGGLVLRGTRPRSAFDIRRRQTAQPLHSAVRAALGPLFSSKHTYSREEVLGGSGIRLVRPGHPFVDALAQLMDDCWTGKTYVTWRHLADWTADHGEWVVFRLVYVIEAKAADPVDGRASIADGYLRPWVEVINLDAQLRPVRSPQVAAIAGAAFGKTGDIRGCDYDGSQYRESVWNRVGRKELARLSSSAVEAGSAVLAQDPSFRGLVDTAVSAARERVRVSRVRLQRHEVGVIATGGSVDATARDIERLQRLEEAVTTIQPRLDSMGVVIISSDPP